VNLVNLGDVSKAADSFHDLAHAAVALAALGRNLPVLCSYPI
jgi:hypothetical protein